MEVLVKHMSEEAPAASSLVPELSPAVDRALQAMLAKEPEARPPTIGKALDALAAAANIAAPSKTAPLLPVPDGSDTAPSRIGSVATVADLGQDSGPVRIVTGSDARIPLGSGAPAASAVHAPSGQTFLAAEADVSPLPRRRARVWAFAAIGLAGVLAAAGGIASLARARATATAGGGIVQSASIATAPTVASASPSAIPTPSASATPPKKDTAAITIDGAPKGAKVSSGGKELGEAPGPFALKAGEKVTLTVSAKGYKTRELSLVPGDDATLSGALEKLPPGKAPQTISKDLEGF
jgi:hypothetical protein